MNTYPRQSSIVTEKSKKATLAKLGLGKLSKSKKKELAERGVLACEEGLSMTVVFRNCQDAWGRVYKLKKSWTVGNIVVTDNAVSVFTGSSQIFKHEWSVPAPITCSVDKPGSLAFTIDFSAMSGDPRCGTLKTSLSTANAERYKAHFDRCSGTGATRAPDSSASPTDAGSDDDIDYGDDYNYNCYE